MRTSVREIVVAVWLSGTVGIAGVAAWQAQAGRGQGAGSAQTSRDNTTQQQNQAPPPTGEIAGTVVVAGAGTPLRRAQLSLSAQEIRGQRSAVTDDKGHFSFVALPAGHYSLSASKPAYVTMVFGSKDPGRPGTPIDLADGQKFDRGNIALPKGSVITGAVVDENGEASPGTQVRVLQFVMRTGQKTLQQAGTAQTDDRGIYRIYGLQPGDYMVSATPRNVNIGDARQSIMAQIDQLMQEAQAANTTGGAGGGGGGGGGGGRGGRGAANAGLGRQAGGPGGRGQQYLDQAASLQQQLAEQEKEQTVGYAPVYYPGTTSATSATTVTVGTSEEKTAIDFQLQLVPTAIVTGTVISPDGHMPQQTQVTLTPSGDGMPPIPGVGPGNARVSAEGKFAFANVTPGQYTINVRGVVRESDPTQAGQAVANTAAAQRGGRGGFAAGNGPGGRGGIVSEVLWATADVTVSGQNLANVVLNLQPGMTVAGHVDFHGTTLPPPTDLTRVSVSLTSQDPLAQDYAATLPRTQVDASGNFTIIGVPPGHYTLRGQAPTGGGGGGGGAFGGRGGNRGGSVVAAGTTGAGNWSLKSAIVDGRDSLDSPFEVRPNANVSGADLTFVDTTQTLKGTLQDSTGRPTSDYTIIVFSADQNYWTPQSRRISSTRPDTDGAYTVRGLPSGDYRIIAVTDVAQGVWYDPAFLSQYLNASVLVSLNDGQTKTQDLKLAGGS